MAKKNTKTATLVGFSTRLPETTLRQIKVRCAKTGETIMAFLTHAIQKALK